MLRKILSLVLNYDRRSSSRVEGKGTSGSKREHSPREDRDGRTQVSQRGVGPKRHAPQVPDPWD